MSSASPPHRHKQEDGAELTIPSGSTTDRWVSWPTNFFLFRRTGENRFAGWQLRGYKAVARDRSDKSVASAGNSFDENRHRVNLRVHTATSSRPCSGPCQSQHMYRRDTVASASPHVTRSPLDVPEAEEEAEGASLALEAANLALTARRTHGPVRKCRRKLGLAADLQLPRPMPPARSAKSSTLFGRPEVSSPVHRFA